MAGTVAAPDALSKVQAEDWASWVGREVMRSARFAHEIEQVCRLAAAPHKHTTGPLGEYSWAELNELEPEESPTEAGRYKRAWSKSPSGGDYPLDHVCRYQGKVSKLAGLYLGSKQQAPAVHEYVRTGRLVLAPARHPAPQGSTASAVAASIAGVDWASGATACRQTRYERQPPPRTWLPGEGFSFYRDDRR